VENNPILGHKPRHFKTHEALTLEALVPQGHFYRELEAKLDLEFVRELVEHCLAGLGRLSTQRG
jgi:hypothetical protein